MNLSFFFLDKGEICLLFVSQTGVVQVNRPLDRERVAEYTLTITVKDNPENPRIARRVSSLSCVHLLQVFACYHPDSFTERPMNPSACK